MKRFRSLANDRGAAAIEFALVLPVLVLLLLGLVEFGRVFNIQISISNAAREGARTMAIENDPAVAKSAAIAAAPSVDPGVTASQVSVSPANCGSGGTAKVRIDYNVTLMTGFFGVAIPLTGEGVMRCGG